LRELSEGLATFVLSLHYALVNQRGTPLNADQVFAIRRGLEQLRDNLFIGFDESLGMVDRLADQGLTTEPAEATALTEVITDESAEQSAG
jgi:hypothetical protein